MAKILRISSENHKAQVQENARKLTVHLLYMPEIDIGTFLQTLVQDRDLWWPNKYRVARFSNFIPAKVKKILRKSQPQSREKLRKLSLREKRGFSYKQRRI